LKKAKLTLKQKIFSIKRPKTDAEIPTIEIKKIPEIYFGFFELKFYYFCKNIIKIQFCW